MVHRLEHGEVASKVAVARRARVPEPVLDGIVAGL